MSETTRKKILSCRALINKAGLLLVPVLILIYFISGRLYYSTLIGYTIGCLSFWLLSESFAAPAGIPAWVQKLAPVISPLKLLLITVVIFMLYRAGFSVIEVVAGLFLSQLSVIFSFVAVMAAKQKIAKG